MQSMVLFILHLNDEANIISTVNPCSKGCKSGENGPLLVFISKSQQVVKVASYPLLLFHYVVRSCSLFVAGLLTRNPVFVNCISHHVISRKQQRNNIILVNVGT